MTATPGSSAPDHPIVTVERTPNSADFFDAAARGELLLKRCDDCSHVRIARRPTCRVCGHSGATNVTASGAATLVTWGAHPARSESSARLLFAMVELFEGPWMESALVDVEDESLRVGLALRVRFVRGSEGETYPAFSAAG